MPARFLALIPLLAFAPIPARAVIGDDLAALRSAYGPAKQVGDQMLFRHDGFSIAVYFDGLHSAMEIFVLDDSQPAKAKTDFTQKDIDAILAQQGGGRPWNQVQAHSGEPTWITADDKLIARFNPGEKTLAVLVNHP
jgi:hypothetical protein